jgi:hypothetical protein
VHAQTIAGARPRTSSVTAEWITLVPVSKMPAIVPARAVPDLCVTTAQSKRQHDSNRNGVLIGATAGATYGLVVTSIIRNGHESGEPGARAVVIPAMSTVIGAYVGWLIDELH